MLLLYFCSIHKRKSSGESFRRLDRIPIRISYYSLRSNLMDRAERQTYSAARAVELPDPDFAVRSFGPDAYGRDQSYIRLDQWRASRGSKSRLQSGIDPRVLPDHEAGETKHRIIPERFQIGIGQRNRGGVQRIPLGPRERRLCPLRAGRLEERTVFFNPV